MLSCVPVPEAGGGVPVSVCLGLCLPVGPLPACCLPACAAAAAVPARQCSGADGVGVGGWSHNILLLLFIIIVEYRVNPI